jgi:rod shape-determining protein MreB
MNILKIFSKIDQKLNSILQLFERRGNKAIGIDLGTANTLVYVKGKGVVLNEPSVVAYICESGINVGYLYGQKAKMMLGKTPMKIDVVGPLSDGVISDFNMAEEMIRKFLTDVMGSNVIVRPVVVIGVPLDSTPVEKRAIQETVERCGVKEAFLIYESMAAAVGAKLPVDQPHGCMIIDIGGGTTEVSIISLGGIVKGKSIRLGGNKMDSAILEYIRHKYHLLIGLTTAEEIKKSIGAAYLKSSEAPRHISIRGRDLKTGTPTEITISEADIVTALAECVYVIIEAVKETLEIAPPELASDIVDRGIVLCGGGALIKNLDYVISEAVNLPVFIPNDPEMCVIRGIGTIVEDYKKYDYTLFKQV